jgi:hypothetical protein
MKNKLLLSAVVISLSILPIISFAETNADASSTKVNIENRGTIKSDIEAKKEALKKEIETKKDSLKNAVAERRQNATDKIRDRVNQFTQTVIERFDATVGRMGKLADRIDSRIAKIEAKNIDVSKAKALMVIAKTKIETAKASIALITIPTNVASSAASTTLASIKEDFKVSKTQMDKAKEDIKAAHAALVDVVNSLKPGDNKMKSSATTAATSTSTTTKEKND